MSLPPCRLFLVTPTGSDCAGVARCLEAAAAAGDVASVLIAAGAGQEEMTRVLTPVAQALDIAVVVERDGALARACGADGVQVGGDLASYRAARKLLGDGTIVGCDCGTSRHAAMELAEAGADYVGFSGAAAIAPEDHPVTWWAALFQVPVVALDPVDEVEAVRLAAGQADFIRPAGTMWESPERASETIAGLMAVLERRGAA